MKKRAFFLTSMPLVLVALVAQASFFYFIFQALAQAYSHIMWNMPPYVFIPRSESAQPASGESSDRLVIFIMMSGVIFAVLSVVCLIISFHRR